MKFKFILLVIAFAIVKPTSANLLVSPTRIIFEGKDRVEDIILINTTNEERSYRVEWEESTVDSNGMYSKIEEGGAAFSASQFLRYSPRQVTLKAGERQIVKLMLRRRSDMNLPEYRSHIRLSALPLKESTSDTGGNSSPGQNLKINVLTSYTMPVIVRTKESDTKVDISNVKIEVKDNSSASFVINMQRSGNSSVTGKIQVFIESESGEEKQVGILNGVNIFHEASQLSTNVTWQNYKEPITGKLRVVYSGSSEFTGTTFDEWSGDISSEDYIFTAK